MLRQHAYFRGGQGMMMYDRPTYLVEMRKPINGEKLMPQTWRSIEGTFELARYDSKTMNKVTHFAVAIGHMRENDDGVVEYTYYNVPKPQQYHS